MFDFRFDDADPPVALEVTSIVDPPFIATARIADRVADELTQIVRREGLGRWYVGVVAGTPLKPLQSRILEAIRFNAPRPPGISDIRRAPEGDPAVVIYSWRSDPDRIPKPLSGFAKELDEAVRSNQSKLAAAVGFERQLAVDLIDMRAEDPASTPVPPLPREIDVVWVFNRSTTSSRTEPMAWWSTGRDWSLSHPWPPVTRVQFL